MQTDSSHNDVGRSQAISRWEVVAFGAAIIILIAPFIYLSRSEHSISLPTPQEQAFVGSKSCATCHKTAFDSWRGSHHDLAMAQATEATVLGDFNNATYRDPHANLTSRFYREDGRFMVETEGPDGTLEAFEITHTFGVFPLQQYLIPFSGGRLQSLNIGWDVRNNMWYRLPPYEVENPDDWLHWTKGGQTWNAMCAECHSTRLVKGYDIATNTYDTSWFEINVGCEACHGPGSRHLDWAERPPLARPDASNYQLAVQTVNLDAKEQISICAPCHSRRYQLGDNMHEQGELLDKLVPSLLEEGLYYPDGQILEEVYVYGSFSQSKMFNHNVRCSDCHNVHSLVLNKEGNELCLQCHRAETYDIYEHHFHQREYNGKPSDGHLCVKCHMPGQVYMGTDYRPDHSLRIPRPDLSAKINTPNSCSAKGCHADKDLGWVNLNYQKWYGKSRKPHYGEVFHAARQGDPGSALNLRTLAADSLLPTIVRATALALLRNHPGDETTAAFSRALQDENALIRYTAIRGLDHLDRETKLRLIAPKLYDSVKGVRIEAAIALADIPESMLRPEDVKPFKDGLFEYRSAMLYNSDFAPQRYNLGNLAAVEGKREQAEAFYREAMAIDTQFYPAKVNLAMLYNQGGENDKAETLLREVLVDNPDLYEVAYSLGLLLAEMQNYQDAVAYLGRAAEGMQDYPRVRYNQALALMKLERWQESERALLKALDKDPANREFFTTLANLYLNFRKTERAKALAESTLNKVPDHPDARELLRLLSP